MQPLTDLLSTPSRLGYEAAAGPGQPAQVELRRARAQLSDTLPPGYLVRASGAARNLPFIPWVAVLDRDVSTTAQEGLYVVYLFAAHLDRAYLSMNQGVTAHYEYMRGRGISRSGVAAREALTTESALVREALGTLAAGLAGDIDLGHDGDLARGYEAGNICSIEYRTDSLPSEAVLRGQLDRMLAIYSSSVDARNRLLLDRPEGFHTPTRQRKMSEPGASDQVAVFRPKNASDYLANVPAQKQHRTRKHEALVQAFGTFAKSAGFVPATNVHPRDLVLRDGGHEYLVEAKTVGANAELAVRAAIGQLFTYRHLIYRATDQPEPTLVALFSEPVGEAFVALLRDLHITAVWNEHGSWASTDAVFTTP